MGLLLRVVVNALALALAAWLFDGIRVEGRDELARVLDQRDGFLAACTEVEQVLGEHPCPSRGVARMLEPWLGAPAAGRREAC